MSYTKFNHEQLSELVEVDPAPEEEWSDIYREWKKDELKDLWIELKNLEERRLRRLKNRREHIEKLLGCRLHVRIPKQLLTPPNHISELMEKT